jgi:DNA-binding PadR family transcriptional regulator
MSTEKLTTPDLVLLSLLAERSMHGYQANALLEFRKVRDWAGVSRPQVYYSLEKLARLGLLCVDKGSAESAGPDRRVYATTEAGRAALAGALEREDWTGQLDRPVFLTWLALSWQCRAGVVQTQLDRRRAFLEAALAGKERILDDVRREVGHEYHEAVWMLELTVAQIKTELQWLTKVGHELPSRSAAARPAYDVG